MTHEDKINDPQTEEIVDQFAEPKDIDLDQIFAERIEVFRLLADC